MFYVLKTFWEGVVRFHQIDQGGHNTKKVRIPWNILGLYKLESVISKWNVMLWEEVDFFPLLQVFKGRRMGERIPVGLDSMASMVHSYSKDPWFWDSPKIQSSQPFPALGHYLSKRSLILYPPDSLNNKKRNLTWRSGKKCLTLSGQEVISDETW